MVRVIGEIRFGRSSIVGQYGPVNGGSDDPKPPSRDSRDQGKQAMSTRQALIEQLRKMAGAGLTLTQAAEILDLCPSGLARTGKRHDIKFADGRFRDAKPRNGASDNKTAAKAISSNARNGSKNGAAKSGSATGGTGGTARNATKKRNYVAELKKALEKAAPSDRFEAAYAFALMSFETDQRRKKLRPELPCKLQTSLMSSIDYQDSIKRRERSRKHRRNIIKVVPKDAEFMASEIAESAKMSVQTAAHHLDILFRDMFLTRQRLKRRVSQDKMAWVWVYKTTGEHPL